MESGELDFLSLDFESYSYYEVEIWENGDCESHFFHYKQSAIRFFDKYAKNQSDCIKFRRSEYLGGDVYMIKEKKL